MVRKAAILKAEEEGNEAVFVEIENIGFARMYQEGRNCCWSMRIPKEIQRSRRIKTDVRSWNPGERVCPSQSLISREVNIFLSMRRYHDRRRYILPTARERRGVCC